MNSSRKNSVLLGVVILGMFVGSVFTMKLLDQERGLQATLEEVLYLPSGKVLKRLSLGYSSLLADIYWTRAVQYFGTRHVVGGMHYELLPSLLDITSDLDPHIVEVYQFGSIFLSDQPPNGAGRPDKAVELVEKGIRENPSFWRLYVTLGFVHYMDRHDYKAAQEAFEKGSEVPGALSWMKVLAARMAENRKDVNTAIALWQAVYTTTGDKDIKQTALSHLDSIQADLDIMQLDRIVNQYHQRQGTYPESWDALISEGVLRGVPKDPHGNPYVLKRNGVIGVQDSKQFPFLNEWRNQ
jgi:hypothetical protein